MLTKTAMRLGFACGLVAFGAPALGQSYEINWYTIDSGGGTSSGGGFELSGTIGQHDAGGPMTGGGFELTGGFWSAGREAGCYADCDGNTTLDVFDFLCFQDAFVSMAPYADCDGNTVFDVFDFLCFQDAFVTGCP
jgi:hypothetical protein